MQLATVADTLVIVAALAGALIVTAGLGQLVKDGFAGTLVLNTYTNTKRGGKASTEAEESGLRVWIKFLPGNSPNWAIPREKAKEKGQSLR